MATDAGGSHRLAEFIACLSLATDAGMGQPMRHAACTCLLAVKAGRALGLSEEDLSDTYYLALLRFVGCTADASEAAAGVGGDEIALRTGLAPVLMAEMPEFLSFMLKRFAADQAPLTRLRLVAKELAQGKAGAKRTIAEHCEVAQILATRMGLRRRVGELSGLVIERWDGKGIPGVLGGEEIPVPARLAAVARDVDVFYQLGGWVLVSDVLQKRRGKAYDPAVVDVLLANGAAWLADTDDDAVWQSVIESEPSPQLVIDETAVDEVLRAFADFVDLKSHFTRGHSTRVGDLAGEAARAIGCSLEEATLVRRAGYVHDLGKAGIPSGIWDKPGALSQDQWERVRLHPYLTERILTRSRVLKPLAVLAGAHHERPDGSGYHKGLTATSLSRLASVLASANAYDALLQERPYRPALAPGAAAQELRSLAGAGKLDREAVDAVLATAGHSVPRPRTQQPAGLTEREVEVLCLISRGRTNKDVARELTLSPKTVGRHIENIYTKIGVSSRAAAAMFAMQHRLIEP
jgi:HD-GYP domain-containing protein (c-di-GMP phosphodiesterase class II)